MFFVSSFCFVFGTLVVGRALCCQQLRASHPPSLAWTGSENWKTWKRNLKNWKWGVLLKKIFKKSNWKLKLTQHLQWCWSRRGQLSPWSRTKSKGVKAQSFQDLPSRYEFQMNCSIGWVRFSENCSISVKWVSHSGWIARSKAAATSKLSKFWFKFTHFPPCSVHSAASWWISQDGGTTERWCVTDVCVGRSASIKPEQLVSQRQAAWHCSRPRVRKETNNQMTKFDEFDDDFQKLHEVTWN